MALLTLADRRKSDRTLRKVALYSIIGLVSIIIGLILFLILIALRNLPTIEYYNLPFPTDKLEYYPTDSIRYVVEFKKFTNVPASVTRQLVCSGDGERYSRALDGSTSGLEKTPDDISIEKVTVITSATPGDVPIDIPCHIDTVSKYEFDAFTFEYKKGRTETFKFVKPNTVLRLNPNFDKPFTPQSSDIVKQPVFIENNTSSTTTNNTTNNNTETGIDLPDVNIPELPDLPLSAPRIQPNDTILEKVEKVIENGKICVLNKGLCL